MTQKQVQKPRSDGSSDPSSVRRRDPNVAQNEAADAGASVWVSASAGAGKTKVLTDRVLRLLLPGADGTPGTAPHKILCLTFTKAAASEMSLRLSKRLSLWAIADDLSLADDLKKLLGRPAKPHEITAARHLFAAVVDTPGGLQIMTIHAFCQSVLSRFPLEAGLTPYFTPLKEEDARALLHAAQRSVLGDVAAGNAALQRAAAQITQILSEDAFSGLLTSVIAERSQLQSALQQYDGIAGMYRKTCDMLGVLPDQEPQDYIAAQSQDSAFDAAGLRAACAALASSNETDQKRARAIQDWLDHPPALRARTLESYQSAFLTQKNEIAKNLAGKALARQKPEIVGILQREAERLLRLLDHVKNMSCAALTRDLIVIAHAIVERYEALKQRQSGLDFDDLILKTLALLSGRSTALSQLPPLDGHAWVSYKLDEGLDHILIDEAQDTNPEQWQIIAALCSDFFTGHGARDVTRTIFTVGDQKQSIYSFQRAAPREFERMQEFFGAQAKASGRLWRDIPLQVSFRTTTSVLRVVDQVFGATALGLAAPPPPHDSHRRGQAGRVELWPVFDAPEAAQTGPWDLPVNITEKPGAAALLAEHIAAKIESWLTHGEYLPARGRAVKPGDIMILVRTRTAFVDQLAKALRSKNIPVSGTDRMILGAQLAVQDLLAAAEFALLPDDDLSLACLLKSPLIGVDEEALLRLAAERPASLWQSVKEQAPENVVLYLQALIANARKEGPFTFFSGILQSACPADDISALRSIKSRLGDDAQDPLDELLHAGLDYEAQHSCSLQGFLHWQRHGDHEIKRDLEGSHDDDPRGKVRIMTIHGAKGLEAPVVILPDTMRGGHAPGRQDRRLLWPDKTGLPVPLWTPFKDLESTAFQAARASFDARMDEEYRRLLYVAMTRAEDRLYVAGYQTRKKTANNNWYDMIAKALREIPETETLEDGSLRLDNPQDPNTNPDRAPPPSESTGSLLELPRWAITPVAQESGLIAKIQASADLDPPSSPLMRSQEHRFLRGNLTHKLLELLPHLPPAQRAAAAADYVRRFGAPLSTALQQNIVQETIALLEHPEFSGIFGPGSRAEVPITGMIDAQTRISGQIDRLLITPESIWIIDYKTNRPPPQNPEDVPAIYRKQLQSYARILAAIYPGRALKCALLWTDGPRLMPIDISLD